MPRSKLINLINSNPSLLKQLNQLKELLKDQCKQDADPIYVNAILTAIDKGIVSWIKNIQPADADIILPNLVVSFSNTTGLQEHYAVYAVSAWAEALDVAKDWQLSTENTLTTTLSPTVSESIKIQLLNAVNLGDLESVKKIIASYPNDNINSVVDIRDTFNGQTPLHAAVKKGNKDFVTLLIENGASPNTKDNDGYTPLHWAAYEGHTDIVTILIKKGADINAKNENGYSPLHMATANGLAEIVTLLIQNGANVNVKNKDEFTPLYWAAYEGHTNIVTTLIECGADVNIKNKDGNTPLNATKENSQSYKIIKNAGGK
jgi:hypothetical protein